MIPRLTKTSRSMHTHEMQAMKSPIYRRQGRLASRPSPAERLRQRRKARVAVMRSLKHRDDVDLHIAYMIGRGDRCWPESRGTTAGQLVAMHLEAEQRRRSPARAVGPLIS